MTISLFRKSIRSVGNLFSLKFKVLANWIYKLSLEGTFARDFKLINQVNGASGSVMDNIAEGFERGGSREFVQFFSIAKGSAGEVRSQLYRALDRNHITQQTFDMKTIRWANHEL